MTMKRLSSDSGCSCSQTLASVLFGYSKGSSLLSAKLDLFGVIVEELVSKTQFSRLLYVFEKQKRQF